MSMLQLFVYWITVSAGLISMGHNVDQWMTDDARRKFADDLRTRLSPDWLHWVRSMNRAFLTLFDAIYRRRFSAVERALWQSVLFSYAILFLARIVLNLFDIPVPETSAILAVALIAAIGSTLFVQAFRIGGQLIVLQHVSPAPVGRMVQNRLFWRLAAYGSSAIFIYTASAILIGQGVGVNTRTVVAVAFGAAIGVPTMLLITLIPERLLPVSPISAVISSVAGVGVLALLFRHPATTFVHAVSSEHWKVGCLILFSLFADMVSLLETRWVLVLSGQQTTLLRIFVMLLLDLLLSASLFLVLPGIVHQDLDVLGRGMAFGGPSPWTGILFWSTFSTSAMFYVFVLAVLLLRLVVPVLAALRSIDRWFPLYDHPARLVTTAMVLISSAFFAAALVVQRAFHN
jgi:hypothetical protein